MLGRPADEQGFSLIELLVVVLILGIVGAITLTGLVQGLQTSARADARIQAFSELQRASERVSRDLRRGVWADIYVPPPVTPPAGCSYLEMSPGTLTLIVFDGNTRYRHRYALASGILTLTRHTWSSGTWQPTSTQEVVRGITNGTPADPVFSYLDADGADLLADGLQNVDRGQVRKFGLRLKTNVAGEDPVEVRTVVGARNGGLPCPRP